METMEDKEVLMVQPTAVQTFALTMEDVKKYIAPKASDQELFMFMNICKSYGLNPFKREVHFIKYSPQDPGTTVVGYEMYLKRAEATGLLDGWDVKITGPPGKEIAVITIHRKDRKYPFTWEVHRSEFDKKQSLWNKIPLFLLRKVAISQGFRLAFPEQLGGMPYTPEEISTETTENLPRDVIDVVETRPVTTGDEMNEVSVPDNSTAPTSEQYAKFDILVLGISKCESIEELKNFFTMNRDDFDLLLGTSLEPQIRDVYSNHLRKLKKSHKNIG